MTGPTTKRELRVWTRFACALITMGADLKLSPEANGEIADSMLAEWRKRRDEIKALALERQAQREAEAAAAAQAEAEARAARAAREREERIALAEANRARVRASLNDAPWVREATYRYTRSVGESRDYVDYIMHDSRICALFGVEPANAPSREDAWPEGFGAPPPGWGE